MAAATSAQLPSPTPRLYGGAMLGFVLQIVVFAALPLSAQTWKQVKTPTPIPAGDTLVVGFLGGWERWDDDHRSVRKLALKLRETPGVHAESIANHRLGTAERLIRRAIDTNKNGKLEPGEKAQARVILYGQSMGGGAVVKMARKLNGWGVPVILTAQVDSFGMRDGRIPPNVHSAVNYYQSERLTIRGQREIRASEPARTRILGNFQMHYPLWFPFPQPDEWHRKVFGGGHARMEADPLLWGQVELIIRAAMTGALEQLRIAPLEHNVAVSFGEK
jgi:hypothetical protein